MQLPQPGVSYVALVRYGRYVSRRLRREKLADLAASCDTASAAVRDLGRVTDDADAPVQDALADRDAADDDLDTIAKSARHKLAGRSLEAAKQAPYTLIFPDGIEYYTDAAQGDEVARYTELQKRITEHLPASDVVRREVLPKLGDAITAYRVAESALANARAGVKSATTRYDASEGAWRRLMEKTYGALVQHVGKAGAERFFPRIRTAKGGARKKTPAAPVA